ncbi:hypothetical protein KI387_041690 [Taxus chinensis]|uniref:Uncharacterized protein n=1 Tax=Taxus chinensis TaxID=29808 RepID=A0AA38C9Z3_TAXCH|nr:hypothetical protein KI387_041690 [Taxus chinensis]
MSPVFSGGIRKTSVACCAKKSRSEKQKLEEMSALYSGSLSDKRKGKLLKSLSMDLSAVSAPTTFLRGGDRQITRRSSQATNSRGSCGCAKNTAGAGEEGVQGAQTAIENQQEEELLMAGHNTDDLFTYITRRKMLSCILHKQHLIVKKIKKVLYHKKDFIII